MYYLLMSQEGLFSIELQYSHLEISFFPKGINFLVPKIVVKYLEFL